MWDVMTGDGCRYGVCNWGNDELQDYSSDNVAVVDGELVITAQHEAVQTTSGTWYTSGRIVSKGDASFLYGRIEARIKLPRAYGLWPAFWMLPTEPSAYGIWAASGEIDIMESANDMKSISGTTHFGGIHPNNLYASCTLAPGVDFSQDYHVYALEWRQTQMKWFVDGQLFCQRNYWSSTAGDYPAPFDAPFRLIFNLAVGGNYAGVFLGQVEDTALPAQLRVDYVRVYDVSDPEPAPFVAQRPACVPGTIEAEKFDQGGAGVAYADSNDQNWGNGFRPDSVDVQAGAASSGGYHITNIEEGEWASYTIYVATAGQYDVTLRASAPTDGGALRLILDASSGCLTADEGGDGIDLTGEVAVDSTNGWEAWAGVVGPTVALPAGTHVVKACFTGANNTMLLDSITFKRPGSVAVKTGDDCVAAGSALTFPRNTAFGGGPWGIPGTVEAEDYDEGGLGVAFFDTDAAWNRGSSKYRPWDGVDIEEVPVGGAHGHYVAYPFPSEYLVYTAFLAADGVFDIAVALGSGADKGTPLAFRLLVNASNCGLPLQTGAVDVTGGNRSFDPSGDWQVFAEEMLPAVSLPAGTHRFVFCPETENFGFDYIRFSRTTGDPTPAPTPAPLPDSSAGGGLGVGATVGITIAAVAVCAVCSGRIFWISRAERRRSKAALDSDGGGGGGRGGGGIGGGGKFGSGRARGERGTPSSGETSVELSDPYRSSSGGLPRQVRMNGAPLSEVIGPMQPLGTPLALGAGRGGGGSARTTPAGTPVPRPMRSRQSSPMVP